MALLALATGAQAVEPPREVKVNTTARVATIFDGQTLALADGRQLRLAAIAVPVDDADRGLAECARESLARAVGQGPIGIAPAGRERDRYGRLVAHVVDPAGGWVQAQLVKDGLARVEPVADQRVGLSALIALEAGARAARRGIWVLPDYRVLTASEAARRRDVFVVMEGRVARVERPRGAIALVVHDQPALRVSIPFARRGIFREAGLDPMRLTGEILRVRGYVGFDRGAMIEAAIPEQVEVVR